MPSELDRLEEAFHRLVELAESERRRALAALAESEGKEFAAKVGDLLAAAAATSSPLDGGALQAPVGAFLDVPAGAGDTSEPTLVEGLRGRLLAAERLAASDAGEPGPDDELSLLPRLPGYRLLQRIGRGGSGTVYLAEQVRPEFTRRVALKVVDRVVDAESRRRVEQERRILARLEHRGIARLYDAGLTPTGQPYLAMERVDGLTITEHCNEGELPVPERLQVFLQVLDAVDYAHRQGVVHRDLKPANILVTGEGEAKLLDFGIAKLVAAPGEEAETRTLGRAMTPAYASPEQFVGDRVTEASDTYSLGVVLYELLAGQLPYRIDGVRFETYEDAVRGQEPEPPSTAVTRTAESTTGQRTREELSRRRRALRGDLDAVVLCALRKDPAARYPTVRDFAEDLRRILAGQPVIARGPQRRHRARSLLRRYGAKAAAALLIAALGVLLFVPAARRGVLLPLLLPRAADEFSRFERVTAGTDAGRAALRAGAAALRRFDPDEARTLFERAAPLFHGLPEEALAWDGVAAAETLRGETGAAAAAARRAADSARKGGGLPRDEAERIAARALAAGRSWASAVPALDRLFATSPARIDLGLELLEALLASGQTEAANTALGRLRQIAGTGTGAAMAAVDPRVELAEARIAYRLGEHQRAAAAATRARDWARAHGSVVIERRARRIHAEAMSRLDLPAEALAELAGLEDEMSAAGMLDEAGLVRLATGRLLAHTADNARAAATLESARSALRAAGDAAGEVHALLALAFSASKSAELEKAEELAHEAVALAREIGDRWCEGEALMAELALANWAQDAAAVRAAEVTTLRALRESANRQGLLETLQNSALSAVDRLDLDAAESMLDEASALAPRVGTRLAGAGLDRAWGYLEETRGALDPARERYLEALGKARRAGIPLSVATYLSDLAWLEVTADRPEAAAARVDEAMAAFESVGKGGDAQEISGLLAWVEARRGARAAASARLARWRRELGPVAEAPAYLSLEARVAEALGDWRRAVDLRRRTVRLAVDQDVAALRVVESFGLVRALAGAGESAEARSLAEPLLAEAELHRLRRVESGLRAVLNALPTGP